MERRRIQDHWVSAVVVCSMTCIAHVVLVELIISSHPLVKGALMFGRSRVNAGVIIEPVHPLSTTFHSESEFVDAIWSSIEEANRFAPAHSRILKGYILISDPVNKPLPRTPKGAVNRKAALSLYDDDIGGLYRRQELGGDGASILPTTWDETGLQEFVSRVIDGTVGSGREQGASIDACRDLFEQGCDR